MTLEKENYKCVLYTLSFMIQKCTVKYKTKIYSVKYTRIHFVNRNEIRTTMKVFITLFYNNKIFYK